MEASEGNRFKPHPLSHEIVQRVRSLARSGQAGGLPDWLVAQLDPLPVEERLRVLREACGLGAALAHNGELRSAARMLHVLTQLCDRFEASRSELEPALDGLRLGIALSSGDLDRLIELWTRLIPKAEGDETPLELMHRLRELREALKGRLGERRAHALAAILLPAPAAATMATLRAEPWLLSEECRAVMHELQATAPSMLRDRIRELISAFDDETGRSPKSQDRLSQGRQRAEQFVSLAAPLSAVSSPEHLFAAADKIEVPLIEPKEAEPLLAALKELDCESVVDVIPHWLVWRAAKQSTWPASSLALLAMELMRAMKDFGDEHEVARRRRVLGEYAMHYLPEGVPDDAVAMLFYALTHTFVTLSEFEGDKPELLGNQYICARRAMELFSRLRDWGFAAQCLDLMISAQALMPVERGGGREAAQESISRLLAGLRHPSDKFAITSYRSQARREKLKRAGFCDLPTACSSPITPRTPPCKPSSSAWLPTLTGWVRSCGTAASATALPPTPSA